MSIKTTWNLGLLYKGKDDPAIERDVRNIERAYGAFEKKYRGKKDYLKSESKLLKALTDYSSMFERLPLTKPLNYLGYALDLDSSDSEARAMSTKLMNRLAENDHKIVFFELSLGKIAKADQKKFMRSKKLAPYRHFLSVIFERSRYNLSEPEEKIMGLKFIPAYQQWVSATDKLLGKTTVEFKGKVMPLPEAIQKVADLPLADRRELHSLNMKALSALSDAAESEMNAIVTDKKINDGLRGYKEPYDATIIGYQNDRKSVLALVDAVTKNFKTSHRFFALKAKLLKLSNLEYSDRAVGIGGDVKKVSFAEAVAIVREAFSELGERYVEIFDKLLENGQVDAFPKVGKQGGAYCSGNLNGPTFIMLNHTDAIDSVMTMAHEMGHAIHTELTKSQPALYRDYSVSTAETASTFFETAVFEALLEKLSDDEKIVMLHKKINDDMSTIFRQIACFNFETELHDQIRAKGGLSAAEIGALMNRHMQAYLGPVARMKDADGNQFIYWSHIRRFFYVYTYAFGQLVSKSLFAKYKEDRTFIKKIDVFLSAGGSDRPEAIFKSIGIDVTKPDFWVDGLKTIEDDIDRLEKLTKNR